MQDTVLLRDGSDRHRAGAPKPAYRIDRSFEWNAANGPDYDGPWPSVPETAFKDFFGLKVRSRLGVAASILTSARWVETYARLGFDLLTYKTVRRVPRLCYDLPNWRFLDPATVAELDREDVAQRVSPGTPERPLDVTAVGSFGMPSSAPEFWTADIARCKALLAPGQVLIVSVVATVGPDMTEDDVLREFEDLARRVRAAGADAVEANLSCPNVGRREGEVFRNPDLSGRIAAAIRRGGGGAPVTVKIGHIAEPELLAALLHALDGKADGVTMINGASRRIVAPDGAPAFGVGRESAGIIGGALHHLALDNVRTAAAVIRRDKLALKVIGVGGASSPARVQAFLDAGAYAVETASGAVWNPHLAVEAKRALPDL
jgi:dihydroorotate dehydrogenase (NAD+) catalytic subunit